MLHAILASGRPYDLLLALIFAVATVAVARIAPARVPRVLGHVHRLDTNSDILLKRGSYLLILFVGGSVSLGLAGYQSLPFFTLGTVGLVLGLSLQNYTQQIVAGATLLEEREFTLGDEVTCLGMTGVVEDMPLRYTRLRQGDGLTIIMPNSDLINNPYTVREGVHHAY